MADYHEPPPPPPPPLPEKPPPEKPEEKPEDDLVGVAADDIREKDEFKLLTNNIELNWLPE